MEQTTAKQLQQGRQFLSNLKDVLSDFFLDGIKGFAEVAPQDDGTTSGVFISSDGDLYRFSLNEDGVRYKPIDRPRLDAATINTLAEVADLPPQLFEISPSYSTGFFEVWFRQDAKGRSAGKKPACTVGYSCGGGCISKRDECRLRAPNTITQRKLKSLADGARVLHKLGGSGVLLPLLGAAAIGLVGFSAGLTMGQYLGGQAAASSQGDRTPPPPKEPAPERPKRQRKPKPKPEATEETREEIPTKPDPGIDPSPQMGVEQVEEAPSIDRRLNTPSSVFDVKVDDLVIAPKLMQYKIPPSGKLNNEGTTGALVDVREWKEELAGVVQAWKTPIDINYEGNIIPAGSLLTSNGHHRVALAKRLGVESLTVRLISASSVEEARTIGALTNAAEGRGTAIDFGKLMRDSNLTQQDLEKFGISMKEGLVSQGTSLANLDKFLWDKVVQGDLAIERGSIYGQLPPEQQRELYKAAQDTKRPINNDTLQYMADLTKAGRSTAEQEEGSLFGDWVQTTRLVERAEISAHYGRILRKQQKLLNAIKPERAREIIERTGVGSIDPEQAKSEASRANVAYRIFQDEIKYQSDLSTALQDFAERLASGEDGDKVKREFSKQAESLLLKALKKQGLID